MLDTRGQADAGAIFHQPGVFNLREHGRVVRLKTVLYIPRKDWL